MNQKTRNKAYATMVILAFAIMLVNVVPASATTIPRNETVWGAGFGQNYLSYQPWNMGSNQGWTTYLMYEPMFGTNVATGSTINWLGKSIAWGSNDRTIVITLRSDIHWTSLDPANALGITNSTQITTDDVIYTFEILQQMGQVGSLVQRVGDIKTAFVKVSDTQLNVTILPAYAGSSEVMRQLTYGWLIFPKAVWQDINTTKSGALQNFDNSWLAPTTPAKWKVASGMYLPFYSDPLSCIAVINPNWWGKSDSDFGRLPNPTYWGYQTETTNDLALLAMERGDLDYDGNYLAGLSIVKSSFPNVATYFPNAPYFPDKSVDLLVPNYKNYPLNQTWLHRAMMSVLDYSAMSAVSSGYLKTPNVMLIPADDAAARATLNETLVAQYNVAYDGTGAWGKSLLSTYCNFDPVTQTWFTKAKVGSYHVPLAEWNGVSNASIAPWKILDFNGWTDVDAMDTIAAYAFTHLLNISVVVDQGTANQWGVVQSRVNGGNFDLFNMVMSGQLNMNMYERYFQMFSLLNTGGAGGGIAAPLGNYTNPTLSNLIEKLDNNTGTALWAVANQIQTIIGTDLPYIPLGGHADWQVYSTTYWTGWPSNATNPILPGSPYAGTTQNANNLLITFGLQSTGAAPPSNTTLLIGLGVVIVVVAVVAVGLLLRRKPGK
jgi:hypothetical protein